MNYQNQTAPRTCPNCNNTISAETNFCTSCGQIVLPNNTNYKKSKKPKKAIVMITICVICVAIISSLIFAVWPTAKTPEETLSRVFYEDYDTWVCYYPDFYIKILSNHYNLPNTDTATMRVNLGNYMKSRFSNPPFTKNINSITRFATIIDSSFFIESIKEMKDYDESITIPTYKEICVCHVSYIDSTGDTENEAFFCLREDDTWVIMLTDIPG